MSAVSHPGVAGAPRRRNALATGFALILPGLLIILVLVVALADLFAWSFYVQRPTGEGPADLTIANYALVFSDPLYLRPLWTTIRLSTITMIACIALSLPLAYWIARAPSAFTRATLIMLVAVPFFVGHIVKLYALLLVLGNTGFVNHALQYLGLLEPSEFIPLVRNDRSVIIGLVVFVLPFTTFILVGLFRRLDTAMEEAAQSLGADKITTFLEVTLPLILPGVVSAAILAFVLAGTAFATPLILGGGAVKMVANTIYDQAMYVLNMPLASSLAVIALVATVAILALSGRLERHLQKKLRHD